MDRGNKSYENITKSFLDLEERKKLFNLKISNVYVWEVARVGVFLNVLEKNISSSIKSNKRSLFQKVKVFTRRIFVNSIFFNPYIDFRKCDIIIFESGRKYRDLDRYIDIYTHYLCHDFDKASIKYKVYETNYNVDQKLFERKFGVGHTDAILMLSKLIAKFWKPRFNRSELNNINSIELDFLSSLSVKVDLAKFFKKEIALFKAEYLLYSLLFYIKRPKKIYLINSCDKAGLIYAAKRRSILVNELQHGLVSNKNVTYNYPFTKEESLHYFPDRFYVWNNIHMFFGKLPLDEKNIGYFPNKHLQAWIDRTKNVPKEKHTILLVSQPYGSKEIQNYILDNYNDLSQYFIYFKIHPTEEISAVNEFKSKLRGKVNIQFIINEQPVYVLLKKSEFVIGIFSSALFEAKAFGCKVGLLNLPGVEMSTSLLDNGDAFVINISDKLIEHLNV